MGRPSLYSPAVVEAICERLSQGEPMAQICRDEGMPAARTVRDWVGELPDVAAAIARAREEGFDHIASECLEIADDSRNDWIERKADEGDAKAVEARDNGEVIQRSKLRIETRLKLLSKWDPKRYGERIQHANDPDNPLVPAQVNDADLDARIQALMGKGTP